MIYKKKKQSQCTIERNKEFNYTLSLRMISEIRFPRNYQNKTNYIMTNKFRGE